MTIGKDGIDIRPFIETIMGKADALRPSISPEMETALMHRMDPARLKRQAISQGLLAFAQKLGSTPGHFLQGMGQAAPVGVGTYLDEKEKGLDTRINTLDTLNKGKRQDQSDALEAAQTKLKTGLEYNKYQDNKTSEAAKAARDVQKHNLSMARDDAEIERIYSDMVSDRARDLGLDDPELTGDAREAAEMQLTVYRETVERKLRELKGRHGVLGKQGEAGGIIDDGTTKTVEGITYEKRNGKWGVKHTTQFDLMTGRK